MSDVTIRPAVLLHRAVAVWRLCWGAGAGLALTYLALTIVSGLLPAAATWLTKLVVDTLVAGQTGSVLLGFSGGLAAVGLASGVLPHVTSYLQAEVNRRINLRLQNQVYDAVNGFEGLSRFENPTFLDQLRMATQATGPALAPATTGLFAIGKDVLTLVSLLVTLAVISPIMITAVVLAAVPALVAQVSLSRQRVSMLAGLTSATRRQFFYSSLITDVHAAKEIRLLGLGDFLKGRVLSQLSLVQQGDRRIDRTELRIQSALALLGSFVAGLGLVWAVVAAGAGALSLGDVTAFIAAVAGAQGAISSLVGNIVRAHEALLMFGYVADICALDNDLPQPAAPQPLGPLRNRIEFRDVWFRYDEAHPWVLRGVTLSIEHGQSVALVGLNGAGKSTLVKLLCRFYDPVRGAIFWDGIDIRDIRVEELRSRMGVLFQDFMCYDLTAAENIGVGDLAALEDRARIECAAKRACVADMLGHLPRGYDTLLSRIFFLESDKDNPETGVTLSGGQWQRLALARTLMRGERDLLILDEPSSGLDAEAEHEIHAGLSRHRASRTSLLISHRLGAVRSADRIAVLADGRLVEQGHHDELIISGGPYARLFTLQADGYQGATPQFTTCTAEGERTLGTFST